MNDLMLMGFEELNVYEEIAINGGSVAADATGALGSGAAVVGAVIGTVGLAVGVVCGVASIICICCLPFALAGAAVALGGYGVAGAGVAGTLCAANMCAAENGSGLACDCGIVPDCCDIGGMTSCQGSAIVDLAAA
ncbi:MAG: hypothetical protein LBT44_01400 [Clostridiales bacterium]|jgi:hypothetical protein|nr:hypothetical protein [Clostridiales bacterium]